MNADLADALISGFSPRRSHREADHPLRTASCSLCGTGDRVVALLAPEADVVARLSPFDPVGPDTTRLDENAAGSGQAPAFACQPAMSDVEPELHCVSAAANL